MFSVCFVFNLFHFSLRFEEIHFGVWRINKSSPKFTQNWIKFKIFFLYFQWKSRWCVMRKLSPVAGKFIVKLPLNLHETLRGSIRICVGISTPFDVPTSSKKRFKLFQLHSLVTFEIWNLNFTINSETMWFIYSAIWLHVEVSAIYCGILNYLWIVYDAVHSCAIKFDSRFKVQLLLHKKNREYK